MSDLGHDLGSGGWAEFQLGGPLLALELFADFMNDLGAGGAIFSEFPGGSPCSQMITAFLALPRADDAVIARVKQRAAELMAEFGGEWHELMITRVADRDWGEEWKRSLKAERLDPGIWIVPSHRDIPVKAQGEPVIRLDPGMAFGTGQHATTRMCVKAVALAVRAGARSMLDIGAGTGLLAMTAALCGAERILGLEIDPIALNVARENLAKNGLQEKIELRPGVTGPDMTLEVPPFDLIAANLFAEMLVKLMPFISRNLAACGQAVCSGILAERAEIVANAARESGLALQERIEEEEWVTMLFGRGVS